MELSSYLQQVVDHLLKEKSLTELPVRGQWNDWTCGAAVILAILDFYNVSVSRPDIAKILQSSPQKGTAIATIENLFQSLNWKHDSRQMTIKDLKRFAKINIPVICLIQAWSEPECNWKEDLCAGHFVVVCGVNKSQLVVMDPYAKRKSLINFEKFLERWMSRERGKCWGLAVYGPSILPF